MKPVNLDLMTPTDLAHVAAKLGRKLVLNPAGQIVALDGQALPTEQELAEALASVRSRKVLAPDAFRQLFTPGEIHAIFRRGTLTSTQAMMIANAWARFTTARAIHSDSPELEQALDLFVTAEILTSDRRARIAAFLPPVA